MDQFVLPEQIQVYANLVLTWVGFGTLVGLLAKAIMPGRDPGGAIVTLAMGIGGTLIGCGLLAFFWEGQRVMPISPIGFLVGTAGTFLILFFYKLLGGYWFIEGDAPLARRHRRPYFLGRRRRTAAYDD